MKSWENNYIIVDESEFFKNISFTWMGWSNCGFIGSIKPYWREPNNRELEKEWFETNKIGWFHVGPISIHIDTGKRRILRKREQAT